MSSQPLDEDGFHSIAWDDAPIRQTQPQSLSDDGKGDDADADGFETISPGSPVASTSTSTVHDRQYRDRGADDAAGKQEGGVEWGGKWMSIEVRDPVKEHEGSKDMFVSYAVRTKVGPGLLYMAKPWCRMDEQGEADAVLIDESTQLPG